MKLISRVLYSLLFVLLVAACDEEKVSMPSVRLEFITAHSGDNGQIQSFEMDNGAFLSVNEDRTNTILEVESQRMIANVELLENQAANIYATASIISVDPLPESASEFTDGIVSHPVELLSIWPGAQYLNIVMLVKTYDSKHTFHFVEKENVLNKDGSREVKILLYHDAGTDIDVYNTKRAYASIPLRQYLNETDKTLSVYFCYYDEKGVRRENGPFNY